MNSEPKPATIKNHSEIGSPDATPPAIARRRKPMARRTNSITGSFFKKSEYAPVKTA